MRRLFSLLPLLLTGAAVAQEALPTQGPLAAALSPSPVREPEVALDELIRRARRFARARDASRPNTARRAVDA